MRWSFYLETTQEFTEKNVRTDPDAMQDMSRMGSQAAKAGAAVPVTFSLGGDQGLDIFEAGYPKSQQIDCDSTAPVDGIEQTVTANTSGLTYDTSIDQYNYVWKSSKGWAGTCRQFVMKLKDGSIHLANFKFK